MRQGGSVNDQQDGKDIYWSGDTALGGGGSREPEGGRDDGSEVG